MALTLLLMAISTALTGWVANDARRRGRRWIVWGALTWFFGLFGVAAWFVARRRSPVIDAALPGRSVAAIYVAALCLIVLAFSVRAALDTYILRVARVEGQAMGAQSPGIEHAYG